MFETAELGQKVSKQEYAERVPELRERLLLAQIGLRKANFPVIVLFGGVDGAGKGETTNLLSAWLDPRWLATRAFAAPSEEERERPPYWRFWRDLPPRGQIGLFLRAWYSAPLLRRVYGESTEAEYEQELERIAALERTLADDGALVLKFWMHLGKQAQRRRLKSLEKDPNLSWRVTKQDWKHWRIYDQFISASEQLIRRTSTGHAQWVIVEGEDPCFRSLRVGTTLLESIERRLAERAAANESSNGWPVADEPTPAVGRRTILDSLDMTKVLDKREYRKRKERGQRDLNLLYRRAREKKISTILVFQGWDAAGKGGAIRRITPALDARDYQVIPIAAPSSEELDHHYLWRFWRHMPRAGRVIIFDRSWYGRVLVERVEGLATEKQWRRAYAEINHFEEQLIDHRMVLVKFWLHITPEEQEARFKLREQTPYKRWKLTEEDWRNREKWPQYETAVSDMIERTSTAAAPWILVEGNDKRYARIKVLESVCARLEERLGRPASERAKERSEP